MKMSEIKEMTTEEIVRLQGELKQERLKLKIQSKTGQLDNPSRLTMIRKDVARIKTEMTARAKAASAV